MGGLTWGGRILNLVRKFGRVFMLDLIVAVWLIVLGCALVNGIFPSRLFSGPLLIFHFLI